MKKDKNSYLINQFIRELQLRNYSPRTIVTYGNLLTKVENNFDLSLDKVSTGQFKDYLHQRITTEGISPALVNQYISAFKILQTDLLKRNWQQIKVKRPGKEKKLPVVLSLSEVERMIAVTRNIKHKAIIMLAYSAGLRRQEVQFIKPAAIDSARMQVHVVQGKGKKDRYTVLSSKTLELLRVYYKYDKPSCFLFEAQGKKGQFLSGSTLNKIVKHSAVKAAGKTLLQCAASPTYLGIQAGAVAILHTWGQTPVYHPHIHMIVPAGGLSEDFCNMSFLQVFTKSDILGLWPCVTSKQNLPYALTLLVKQLSCHLSPDLIALIYGVHLPILILCIVPFIPHSFHLFLLFSQYITIFQIILLNLYRNDE